MKEEERESLNHKGMSFAETCLSVFILMVLFGSLIPFSYHLKTSILYKKLDYHASEVALEAAKIVKDVGQTKGTKIIDHVQYDWEYNGGEICVTYRKIDVTERKCISRLMQY